MECVLPIKDAIHSPQLFTTLIQIYNILIGVLNISGNATLIWALRRTRQIKSLSFQMVIIMSSMDLAIGIQSLVFLPLMFDEQYQSFCWQKLTIQFLLLTCNYVSVFMLLLIALDRYLHMKYLVRYSLIVTKKRGYYAIFVSAFLAISISAFSNLQISSISRMIIRSVYETIMLILLASVILIYYAALRAIRRKAHQLTGNIINRNKTLGRAAKRISICILILSAPVTIFLILNEAACFEELMDPSIVYSCIWIGYITFLGNGFCSSIIFISQNRPIKRMLRRVARNNLNRIRPVAETMETQA